jgi:hypothetical protein
MRRRSQAYKRFKQLVATLVIGILLGFLVPTIAADLTPAPEEATRAAESPVARQFIDAYVSDDQVTLDRLGIAANLKAKAARFKAEYRQVDLPIHLGSWVVGGGITLHAYAAHVIASDGTGDQLAWRVATGGGSVDIIPPPPSVQTP